MVGIAAGVQQRQGGLGKVAFVGDLPFVVGFDEDRAGQPQQRGRVREDTHDVGAALNLLVQSFERVGAPDLFPMRDREIRERGDIWAGLAQHGFDFGQLPPEHAGDGVELLTHVGGVGLGEDGADRRGDHLRRPLGHLGQHVAQEMHPAALPGGAGQDRLDRGA